MAMPVRKRGSPFFEHFFSFDWDIHFTNIFPIFKQFIQLNYKASHGMPTNPICKFSASRSLSCAMELNITPPCLLVNGLGYEIFIVDSTSDRECCVPSNHIAPMPLMVIWIESLLLKHPIQHVSFFLLFIDWIFDKVQMSRWMDHIAENPVEWWQKFLSTTILFHSTWRLCNSYGKSRK